jgi:error-prone DNA polymerase
MYVELHARSAFSFLEGSTLPEDLISVCAARGMSAMALLDRDGLYGSPRFHLAAKKIDLKAHIGAEVSCESLRGHKNLSPQSHRGTEKINKIEKSNNAFEETCDPLEACHSERSEEPAFSPGTAPVPTNLQSEIKNLKSSTSSVSEPALSEVEGCLCGEFKLPLLVSSRAGYQNLCQLLTRMKLRAQRKEEGAVLENELAQYSNGLICLTGGDEGPLAAALKKGGPAEARRVVDRLTGIFGSNNVYVELQRHYHREEEARNRVALEIARDLHLPLLATNGVCYATPHDRPLCDVFTALRHKRTLMTAGRLLARNSERHIKTPEEMSALFADFPEAIANTAELSSRLEFKLNDLGYEFPRYPVPEGETMMSFLRQRADEGARWRYGISLSGDRVPQSGFHNKDLQQRARRQIERELQLIEKLDLPGYFLIVWDIVRFCREQNILAQGRGSAANSAVCYSLGITAVDPVGMELLFERFLSEERGEWPDIDIDLPSGDQRERVIQHIYQLYGQRGAAMTANVITYRNRMAAREMGKAMGFDPETLNKISAAVATWEYKDANDALDRRLHDAGLDLNHPRLRKYFELCTAVQDLPRHLGQHSGGMVICQGQLDSVVPLEPASMPGRVVVQWDKEDCADMGIIKVDLLGLGMMAVLEDSIQLIRDDYHEEVDLAHLPPDDPEVYATLQKADTVGMFQIESRAQMSCLPRLRPQKFYDIVVQVAIIRPGPIVGQMVNPFLQRRQGREAVTYPHPSLEPVLARTLGVPLFQEQLLRIAMISANFTGGEAEELRRAMGFKRSQARMKEIEAKLREGMTRNGIAQAAQEQIILSITSFALYGFPESHAASFALIAYASAWLKCHYLGAFTAALLNNQPMGFYHPATLVKDAQRHGLKVLPIDVLKSDWLCTLEPIVGRRSSVVGEAQAISHQPSAISQTPPDTSDVSMNTRFVSGHGFSRAVNAPNSNAALAAEVDVATPNVRLVNRFIAGQGFDPSPTTSCLPGTPAHETNAAPPTKFETTNSTEIPWEEIGTYARSPHTTNPRTSQRAANLQAEITNPKSPHPSPLLKTCHPERSEGPAFLLQAAPPSTNPQSEIKNLKSHCEDLRDGKTLALRLGLKYVRGLRESAAQALVRERSLAPFQSIHDLTRRVPELRKDELTTLAEIGALNSIGNSPQRHPSTSLRASSDPEKTLKDKTALNPLKSCHSERSEEPAFPPPTPHPPINLKSEITNLKSALSSVPEPALSGVEGCLCGEKSSSFHRRDALWQIEKAVRRSGPLLEEFPEPDTPSPLKQMTYEERLVADFNGTGLTTGPHPMAYRRAEMQALGIYPASSLKSIPSGRRLRIGGCVIARQRPGTAKGFVFLSLEDETGIANAIVTPDLLQKNRILLISGRFLMVEGILQNQDNVISVKAERVLPLNVTDAETSSHDFH